MRFSVNNARYNMKNKFIEVNSLEELHAFAKEVNETLVIKFPGVSSNSWSDEKQGEIGSIILYDDYLE